MRKLKKITQTFWKIVIFLSVLLTLTGCNQQKEEENIHEKAVSEIEYFGSKFISILNRLNNITFENYQITASEVELNEKSASQGKSSSSGSSQDASQGNSSGGEDSGGGSGGEGNGGTADEQGNTIIASQMAPNTILNPQTTRHRLEWNQK